MSGTTIDVDAVVVGAGVAGLYQLHRLRSLGMTVRVFEAGNDVGGTWYWNRYPGARFDSESYSYGYSFSDELVGEWRWSEHFAAQPETLRYLQHVADRFDLRRDITFGVRVVAATWDHHERSWVVALDDGSTHRARFLILAIGVLSVPKRPDIEGLDDFEGSCLHTGEWPHEPVDTAGRRVGVIGTGASAVQLITELATTVGRLSVFQRTASWCAPLGNGPIDEATQHDLRAHADEIFERCRTTFGGFVHDSDRRKALEVSAEERTAFYEELYAQRGFAIWMGNFRDVLVNEEANATLTEFMAGKIRERVDDPALAELLIPTDHGFGTRRVPLESGYYEAFNRGNVELIDLRREPIIRVTRRGIETAAAHYDLDVLVLATGFDAVTGPYDRIDIRGINGGTLREAWAGGPRTYLGLTVAGFPNLFLLVGPHNAASFCNMPRCIEHNVDWLTTLMGEMAEKGQITIRATEAGQNEWTAEVHESAQRMLFSKVDSWFTGRNSASVPSGQRSVLLYAGGFPRYQERCAEVAADGYRGFRLS